MLIWNFLDGDEGGAEGGDDAATAASKAGEQGDDKGGKPSDAEAKLLKEVMEKKEALKKAKEEAKAASDAKAALEAKLAEYAGIDLEEIKTLAKEKADREVAELEKKGEFDRVKKQMVEAHQKELERLAAEKATKETELSEALSRQTKQITELTIGRSFSESPFIREALTLTPSKARVVYGGHFELQEGKVVAYDKPAGSTDRTMLVDGDGEPLAFEKAIEKLVEIDPDRDNLLRSKIKAGSGSANDPEAKGKERKPELRGRDRIRDSIKNGGLKLPTIK